MSEKDFLILLAIRTFNAQYGRSLVASDFDVMYIPNNQYSDLSFEVYALESVERLRLRVYLKTTNRDSLGVFRLEVDGTEHDHDLGDEVYVTLGTIDKYYTLSNTYRFNTLIVSTPTNGNAILLEDGSDFLLEDGSTLLLEIAA